MRPPLCGARWLNASGDFQCCCVATREIGCGTRNLAGRTQSLPSFFSVLASLAEGRVLPFPGGVLVRSPDGTTLGAVGASGDVSDNDEVCAVAGIKAVGLTADPGTG